MNIERTNADGLVTYRLIDHGDGHGVEVHYDADGVESHRVDRDDLPIVVPDPQADAVVKATALAMALLSDPDRLATLVAAVTNTAKGALTYVSDAIQTAAEVQP